MRSDYCLCLLSSDTVNFFLPLALLLAKTERPLALDMRSLKPCLFLRFLCDGWYVLFILSYSKQGCKDNDLYLLSKDYLHHSFK